MNPIAIIASTIEAVAALSMSAVRSLLYFLAKPTTASLVVSRNNNPVIPFVIFQSLALFPLVIFANIDLNELNSLEPVAPLIHRIKIADLGAAILYFFISYPLVNVVSYSLKKKKYIFRSITRAVQNIFGFTLFISLAGTIFTMAVLRRFLVFQEESSLIEHPSFLNYVLTFAWTGLMMIFLGLICYRLIYRSKTQFLNRVVATGGSILFCGIFFLSVNLSAYFYPSSSSRHLVESFKCIANDKDLNVRVVLKNDTDKSVFIDGFLVLVKDSTALSNDVAKGYWATAFKVGGEGKPEHEVVIFPDARILLSFDVEFSNSDDLMGKSCSIPLNPTRWQGTAADWQNIQVRKLSPPEPAVQDQEKK